MKLKIKDKEELSVIAKSIFDRYRSAKNVAVTSDGTAFITDENDLAVKNYSANNRYGKKLAITEFTRDDFASKESKGSGDKKTAKELIAEIEAAATVEAVAVIVEAEKAGEKRKTVLEAADAKLKSLKTAE